MNLQYFYNFVIIVEEGSLTAAARKLNIAQPALSNQIKAMEKKSGGSPPGADGCRPGAL